MGFQIEDGTGSGLKAKVDNKNELVVAARVISRSSLISEDDGQSYTWTSTYSAAAAEETASLQNTSTNLNLHIDRITVAGVEATAHAVLLVTSGTPAGTDMPAINNNKGSSNSAASTGFGNASVTGSVVGDIVGFGYHPVLSSYDFEFDDAVILGQDDIIAVRSVAGTTGIVYITIRGFYD